MNETHDAKRDGDFRGDGQPIPPPAIAALSQRLRDACIGHPTAMIPWPHRLLHEAADALADLAARVPVLEQQSSASRLQLDEVMADFVRADQARQAAEKRLTVLEARGVTEAMVEAAETALWAGTKYGERYNSWARRIIEAALAAREPIPTKPVYDHLHEENEWGVCRICAQEKAAREGGRT